jgi:hypothetical protein
MRIGHPGWSIEIAPNWEAQDDAECITITASKDSGALQVSSAIKEIGNITDAELLEFAAEDGLEANVSPSALGQFSGFMAPHSREGLLWHNYWLRCGSLMIFATYIVEPSRKVSEWSTIQQMLRTLRAEAVGP